MILDSSAIARILLTRKGDALRMLGDGCSLDLARYEIGNVLWKEAALFGSMTGEEAASNVEYVARIMEEMRVFSLGTPEEAGETMELAVEHGLTYYDAAYVYRARGMPPLVTEDRKLIEKAVSAGVEAVTVGELDESGD